MMDLNTLWFLILGVLLAGYIVLDGYDLGIGVIHLFTTDRQRRDRLLALLGPYWDGNEVWLIIAGGVLFAVFPTAYAALLSAFYPYFICLLFAFIVRGLAIDLRNKHRSAAWRRLWDICLGSASLIAVGLVGIIGANLARGVATDSAGMVQVVDVANDLGPGPLFVGVLAIASLTMHGALYTVTKSSPDQRDYFTQWAFASWALTLVMAVPATALNLNLTGATAAKSHPVVLTGLIALLALALCYIPAALRSNKYTRAFWASGLVIVELLAALAMLLHPRLIRSTANDAYSLTIYNAAATRPVMMIMLVIVSITVPLAIGYMVFVRLVLARSGHPRNGYATNQPTNS